MWQKLIEWNGEIHNIKEWSDITGIRREIISYRLKSGMPLDEVFISDNINTLRVSICWDCKNSVPNEKYGCSWSRNFEPVKGWNAIETSMVINDYSKNVKTKTIKSYCVCSCPKFIKDKRTGKNVCAKKRTCQ